MNLLLDFETAAGKVFYMKYMSPNKKKRFCLLFPTGWLSQMFLTNSLQFFLDFYKESHVT